MNETRMDVTEKQLDALAGRIKELERQAGALIKALSKPAVLARTGMTQQDLGAITYTFLTAQSAELRHYTDRAKALRTAERDALFDRLRTEPGLAFPEARRELAKLDAPVRERRRRTVRHGRARRSAIARPPSKHSRSNSHK